MGSAFEASVMRGLLLRLAGWRLDVGDGAAQAALGTSRGSPSVCAAPHDGALQVDRRTAVSLLRTRDAFLDPLVPQPAPPAGPDRDPAGLHVPAGQPSL